MSDANAVEGHLAHISETTGLLQHSDHLAIYPMAYPRELAQDDPQDLAHLAGPQIDLPERQDSFTVGNAPGGYGAQHDFRQPANQVGLLVQAWNQNGFVEPGSLHSYTPHGYVKPSKMEEVFFQHEQASTFQPQEIWQHKLDERSWLIQQSLPVQRLGQPEAFPALLGTSLCDLGMNDVLQQAQPLQDTIACVDTFSDDVYSQSNNEFVSADLASAYSDSVLSGVPAPPQRATAAPQKSAVCPECEQQLQDAPGLRYGRHTFIKFDFDTDSKSRHHLDVHDPAKTSRYKCDHDDCDYASRYPKDVRRHKLVHEKPKDPKFVCSEPGCDRKFHRNDYLLRHRRSAHRIFSAADVARSNKKRGPRPKHLTVPNPRRQRAASASSTSTPLYNGESSTIDRCMIQQAPQTPVRPSRVSIESSSAAPSIDDTHGNSTPGFDPNSLMPTPYTGMTSFSGGSDSQYFPPTSPSESFYFSAPGSPWP